MGEETKALGITSTPLSYLKKDRNNLAFARENVRVWEIVKFYFERLKIKFVIS